jgi:LCP family protein required for cell wall assembly
VDRTRSPWRAFGFRYLTALAVAFVLTTAGLVAANQVIDDKLAGAKRVDVKVADGPAQGGNFLIIGSDTRAFVKDQQDASAFGSAQQEGGQRSDTLMVVHIDPDAKKSLLVSFPRDTIVNVPGHGRDLINSAFNDGPDKVIETLKANFDIDINHYIEVDFQAFQKLVDAIGQVPVYFDAPARDQLSGLDIQLGGCVRLNGGQALAYVRSRHLQFFDTATRRWKDASPRADLDRITRQQNFIRRLAGLAAAKASSDLTKALDIADAVVPELTMDQNLGKKDIFRLVNAFRHVNPEDSTSIEMVTLPTVAAKDGAHLLPKQPEADQVLARLRGDASAGKDQSKILPSQVRVRVLNGSGVDGVAGGALANLQQYSFAPSGAAGNTSPTSATTIRYRPGNLEKAQLVAKYVVGSPRLQEDSTIQDADVVLVIGKDFDGIRQPSGQSTSSTSAPPTTTTVKGGKPVQGKEGAPPTPAELCK